MHVNSGERRNLKANKKHTPYRGGGLFVARAAVEGVGILIYVIGGRSASSRNRRFVAAGTTLRTEPIDTSHMERPELLIYEAMLELPSIYLVSNGDQTRTIYDALQTGRTFHSALATPDRKPDAPPHP